MKDLELQIVGHMIFYSKFSSYCPIVIGIRKVEKLINGGHIKKSNRLLHRFNVVFLLGGAFYFHREHIIEFLKCLWNVKCF